ncbi:MAG: hypothetical protein ACYC6Y_02330, partial [Thermoguttaceae bacterium]
MTDSGRKIWRGVAPRAVLVATALCVAGIPAACQAQAVWELTPYRFHVYLALQPGPEFPRSVVDQLGTELISRVDSSVGAAWLMSVSPPEPALRSAMLAGVEGLGTGAIPESAFENDKVTLVTIVREANGFRLAARELDVRTRRFSAVVEKNVPQAALLSDALFTAVTEAFAPLAAIQASDGEKVELRLRAGRLTARDTSLPTVQPGMVFVPIVRYDDRDGNPKKILPLPWTYLAVEKVDESRLACQLYSGLRSALAGRRRGRVQELALAVKPSARATRLVI